MELKAYAKINLSIDVLSERDDGYHEVRMIMQSISLHDNLRFNRLKDGIRIHCSNPDVPCDRSNVVCRVLEIVQQKYHVPYGMEIFIEKEIPVAAGLAGGSTDAAAAIIAANNMWDLNMSYTDMINIGKEAGADIPFCIKGGTALAGGIGEKITMLNSLEGVSIVIAKPPIAVSTKEVYKGLKMDEIIVRPDMDKLIGAVNDRNIRYIAENMINVLEGVSVKKHPVIQEIKSIMVQFGALGSLMSGSGPTVFGIFENRGSSEKCYNRLKDYIKDVYMVETI